MDYRSYVSSAQNSALKIVFSFICFLLFSLNVYASDASSDPSDPSTWEVIYTTSNYDRGGSWVTGNLFLDGSVSSQTNLVANTMSLQDFIDVYYDRNGNLNFNNLYNVGDTLYFELKPNIDVQGFDVTNNPNSYVIGFSSPGAYGLVLNIDNVDYFLHNKQTFTLTTTMRSKSYFFIYPLFMGSVYLGKTNINGTYLPEIRLRYGITWDITIKKAPAGYTASSVSVSDTVLTDTIKKEHQEEIDTANKANSDVSQGVGQVTDVLSSWEIFKLPVTVTSDLVTAITAEGSSSLTFPSFSLMGYELWPSYTFDLQYIAENFSVLYNALHTVTGIMIVGWFIHYLWRKWHILTGDDTPEGS